MCKAHRLCGSSALVVRRFPVPFRRVGDEISCESSRLEGLSQHPDDTHACWVAFRGDSRLSTDATRWGSHRYVAVALDGCPVVASILSAPPGSCVDDMACPPCERVPHHAR